MEPEGQLESQKWEVFSTVLLVRTSFYFMNQNYFIIASSIQKNIFHPRSEVYQIMKIAIFTVKPLMTLTYHNSLINPVADKFYLGLLIRVANETSCESLIDQ